MSDKLDEKALRREGFQEGTPIEMADGQEWHLPAPRVVLVPTIKESGGVGTAIILEDLTYWDLLEQIDLALKSSLSGPLCAGVSVAAIRLLVKNYDLSLAQAASLIPPMDPENPSGEWRTLLDAVSGIARPKLSAGGSE